METRILIIYTGGTIGMVHEPGTGALVPFNFDHILEQVPELKRFGFSIDTIAFDPLLDSSEVTPPEWVRIATIIEDNYEKYTGFVVLHGTDTMAYSASALSFMIDNLSKPVIFTGSQLPIGMLRTDGKENLISAIEIAAATHNGKAMVPEVTVYFENSLLRGNRTTKLSTEHFNAFASPNLDPLATSGINIRYNRDLILYPTVRRDLQVNKNLSTSVALLRIFPGIERQVMASILRKSGIRGLVLESFGAGNAPTADWFLGEIRDFIASGGIVLNITQCFSGGVQSELYETGRKLTEAGVISGADITTEAALTKMMYLLGDSGDNEKIKMLLKKSLKGEITL